MQGPKFLSAEQVLLTTLVVKLAVMAALATMLVRYRRFRHILIFERRDWPDRLTFALSLGIPLTAGVVARLLLGYNAADLTLEGAFLAGLIAGPYAGATVGVMVGMPPLVNGEWVALPFAVGCGFAGGGLRELCPKEAIWHFSPFVFTEPAPARLADGPHARGRLAGRAAARAGRARAASARRSASAGATSPAVRPRRRPAVVVALMLVRPARHGALRGDADQDLEQRAHRAPAAGAGEAAARREDRGARQPDQPALPVQHADVDLVADPHPAGNRAHADHQAVGAAPPPDAQHRSLRHAARGARVDRRVPRHRGRPLRAAAAGSTSRSAPRRSTSSCRA